MASLPKFCSVFRSPHKRKYVIVVDTFFHKKPKVYFDSLTYNSRVGIAGHELAHIASYQKLSSFKFIGFLFSYAFSSKYRTKIEKRTDELTIDHNLGEELYELSYYIFNKAVTSEKYKRYKSKHYYKPTDIRALVDKYNKLKTE